ncbi:MAG: hypothetical protein QG614_127 [Patescibacteria group bacterium]|nr:hypothetical protein [Patescibacteria group bacterium]
MTKEQKILYSLLLVIMVSGAVWYVNDKNSSGTKTENYVTSSTPNGDTSNTDGQNNNSSNNGTNSSGAVVSVTSNINSGLAGVNASGSVNVSANTIHKSIAFKVPDDNTNTLDVTLTLDGNTITNVQLSQSSANKESSEYAKGFLDKFNKNDVVGKKVSDVNLSRVGGASLTTNAFNKVVLEIASQI